VRGGGVRATVVGILVAGLLGSAALRADRGTLERGNRLYRGGDTIAAQGIYRSRAMAPTATAVESYNLATSLLTVAPDEADRLLRGALAIGDTLVANPGFYNLGYSLLTSVRPDLPIDSVVALLRGAITSNRIALRFDLSDEDARWNLALSQRLMDSIALTGQVEDRQEISGQDETRIEDLARTRSEMGEGESGEEPEQPRDAENVGLRRGAANGAREAWASQDPGPLTEVDATRLLERVVDDPEQLVRGLLWAHRPDVPWWATRTYPGGNW
jgi:hypothetical protein